MGQFNKSALLDYLKHDTDRKLTPIEVPEWGFEVYVKPISYEQLKALLAIKDDDDQAIETIVASCCDDEGNLLFADTDTDWRAVLRDKLPSALTRIANAAMAANKATVEAAKELEKN